MSRTTLITGVAVGIAFAIGFAAAQNVPSAPDTPIPGKPFAYPQTKPIPILPKTSDEERERNKQLVLDFYHFVPDKKDWSWENVSKYFSEDFIQHDPKEPSGGKAFAAYMGEATRRPGLMSGPATGRGGPEIPQVVDSNRSPIETLFADGPYVIVVRSMNMPWSGGPAPIYRGQFADIWRIKNGKIVEQWCTCTDANGLPNAYVKEMNVIATKTHGE